MSLIRSVSAVDGLRRLRLFYLYPKEIRPALIEEMSSNDRIADYFDLSLQHSSARLLRAMRRPGSGDHHRDLIESIRDRCLPRNCGMAQNVHILSQPSATLT